MEQTQFSKDHEPAPCTLPGLHEVIFDHFSQYAKPGSQVLDLGAGQGAWGRRLMRAGHTVTAVERDTELLRRQGIRALSLDLNTAFAESITERFDVITAIEVIEHLENPRHLLRQCHALLNPEGFVIISTPNVESALGRLRFLRTGELSFFGSDPRYNDLTHITPIHSLMFERAAHDTGFKIVAHSYNRPSASAIRHLPALVARCLAPLMGGRKGGDCHIWVLKL